MAQNECPRHPGTRAVDLCVSCADPVCSECGYTTADARVFCPGCADEGRRSAPPPEPARVVAFATPAGHQLGMQLEPAAPSWTPRSSQAGTALFLSLLGVGCFPFGIWGYAFALGELKRIRLGRAVESGRGLCYLALALNAFTALSLLVPLVLAVLGALERR